MACTFQATIGGKFAPLIGLMDDDIYIDTIIITTDAASEILRKERRSLDSCPTSKPFLFH